MSRRTPMPSQEEIDAPEETTQPPAAEQLTQNVSADGDGNDGNDSSNNGGNESNASNPLDGLARMPDIQPHAIEAAGETVKAAAAANAQYPGFDPNIHAVDANGAPIKNKKTGEWNRKRGRGAKGAGGASTFKPAGAGQAAKESETAAERAAKIDSTATVVTELIFMGGKMLGGQEWEPRVDKALGVDERAVIKSAWAEYFRIRGIMDIPPEVMVIIAVGGYAVPRFFQPQTKSRVQKAKEWFYAFVARRRARRGTRGASGATVDATFVPVTP